MVRSLDWLLGLVDLSWCNSDHGNERSIPLDGLSEDAVGDRVKLAYDIGRTLPRWPVNPEDSQHEAITDGNEHWSVGFYKNRPVKEVHPDQ
jgi:hypothetical protein